MAPVPPDYVPWEVQHVGPLTETPSMYPYRHNIPATGG